MQYWVRKLQVLQVITSDLAPTFPSNFSYTSYQLLPSQFKRQSKHESQPILLCDQHWDTT
jgi:hypothetical protein